MISLSRSPSLPLFLSLSLSPSLARSLAHSVSLTRSLPISPFPPSSRLFLFLSLCPHTHPGHVPWKSELCMSWKFLKRAVGFPAPGHPPSPTQTGQGQSPRPISAGAAPQQPHHPQQPQHHPQQPQHAAMRLRVPPDITAGSPIERRPRGRSAAAWSRRAIPWPWTRRSVTSVTAPPPATPTIHTPVSGHPQSRAGPANADQRRRCSATAASSTTAATS